MVKFARNKKGGFLMKTNLKVYTLTGAGTEIDNFNVADTFEKYIIKIKD